MADYIRVDVFTEVALEGNPLAVFIDAADLPASTMQSIAREMNLSETTFVLPPRGDADVRVRIFTPVNELPFAGHPILGTAIALAGTTTTQRQLLLETAMGTIKVTIDRAGTHCGRATVAQPIPVWERYPQETELLSALGMDGSTIQVEVYRNGPRHAFVGLETIDALSCLEPDQRALAQHTDVAVNCFAGSGTDWRMRMFSPAYGVAEDAATGSAAGPLAVHLARHGKIDYGQRIAIRQGVEIGRPSLMYATADGVGPRVHRVEVAGSAVVVGRGTLLVGRSSISSA